MPCGKQYCEGTLPAPPFLMSARFASKTAWYSAVNGGFPAGVQFGGPTRSHCPFRSGYLDSSNASAPAEAITSAAIRAITRGLFICVLLTINRELRKVVRASARNECCATVTTARHRRFG